MSTPTPTPTGWRSAIFSTRVLHERLRPGSHRFSYGLSYLLIDLQELPQLASQLRLLRFNRPGFLSLHEADFLPPGLAFHGSDAQPLPSEATLRERALAYCAQQGLPLDKDTRVSLLALPRILGRQFNPVAFYFFTNPSGVPLAALAEVTNTFGEMKPFLIRPEANRTFHLRCPKAFYVSPFSEPDLDFDFTLHAPEAKLAIRIDEYDAQGRVLHSTLTGSRQRLSDARLLYSFFRHPLLGLRVITLIHWQALRLWLKKIPWFAKAYKPEEQTRLLRPHHSLTRHPRHA